MPFPRPASPRALASDFRAFFAERSRHQIGAAVAAVAMPVLIIIGFVTDARTNTAPGEQIVYVENWDANRTDEEIIADQKRRQAEAQAAGEERQRQFQKLERFFGM